jgi:hypothetical protein
MSATALAKESWAALLVVSHAVGVSATHGLEPTSDAGSVPSRASSKSAPE